MFYIRLRHVAGMLVGVAIGLTLASLGDSLGYNLASNDALLWGGAIGSVVAGLPEFSQAGAMLTRRENRPLNSLVGLFMAMLLVGVLLLLVTLLFGLLA